MSEENFAVPDESVSYTHLDVYKRQEKHMYYYNGAGQRYELPERPLEPEENRYETVRNRPVSYTHLGPLLP